jgi:hypothetical protein
VVVGAAAVFEPSVVRLSWIDDVGTCFAAKDLEGKVLNVSGGTVLISRRDCIWFR